MLLLLVLYTFLLVPQKEAFEALEGELAEKELECRSAEDAATDKAKADSSRQIQQLKDRLGNFVLDSDDLGGLTFSISRIAGRLQVGSFASRESAGESYLAIPNCNYIAQAGTAIDFTSSFGKFAAVINALERHKPVIFVNNFTISKARKGDSGHKVSMSLTVFVKKPPEELPDADSADSQSESVSS